MLIEESIHFADCYIDFVVPDVEMSATRKDLVEISLEPPQIGVEIGWDLLCLD